MCVKATFTVTSGCHTLEQEVQTSFDNMTKTTYGCRGKASRKCLSKTSRQCLLSRILESIIEMDSRCIWIVSFIQVLAIGDINVAIETLGALVIVITGIQALKYKKNSCSIQITLCIGSVLSHFQSLNGNWHAGSPF